MTGRASVVAVLLLVVVAGCAGGDAADPTDIVDTVGSTSTGTPTDQRRPGGSPSGESATPTSTGSDSSSPATAATVGASRTETRTATATRTAAATATASATATPEPTPTDTATPSATATSTAAPTPETDGRTATVVEVVDGDTVKLRFSDGSRGTARLLGVDTPETHAPATPDEWEGVPDSQAGRSCLSAWGDRATAFTRDRLLGETVRVAFDENEPKRGYYDRLLVYVHLDGELFNDDLVRRGYARVYTDSRFTEKAAFLEYEAAARDAGRGAWACRDATETRAATDSPTPEPTETPRNEQGADSGALVVDAIHADAAGNDHENENDEWIRFRNAGDATLDVSGWTVSDAAGHDYVVPAGTTLEPGASITLYTGSGADAADSLYWGSDAAIWNNEGDTVVVRDASGAVVLRESY